MAILGLTHQGLSVPKIGMIRKGDTEEIEKRGKNGKYTVTKPIDLDYFRVEFDTGDEIGQRTAQEFKQVYGDKPRDLRVTFHSDQVNRVWEAYAEAYTASRLVARIDYTEELGQHFLSWFDLDKKDFIVRNREPLTPYTGQLNEGSKFYDVPVGSYMNNKNERVDLFPAPVGRLKVILRDLPTFRLGYLLLNTGSKHDISNLDQQIRYYEELFKERRYGFAGVDFILRRRPYEKQTPFGRREIWLLSLEIDPDQARLEHAHMHKLSMPTYEALPEIAGGNGEIEYIEEAEYIPGEDDYDPTEFDPALQDAPFDEEVDAVENKERALPAIPNLPMSYETAWNETDAKGNPYGNIDQDILEKKMIGISKKLKLNDLPPEDRELYQRKHDAVLTLRAYRAQADWLAVGQ